MEAMHLFLIGISVWSTLAGAFDNITLEKPQLYGPSVALERSVEDYVCEMPSIPPNVSVLLKLYVERNLDKAIGEHTVIFGEEATFPLLLTKAHDGKLICEASGNNNTQIQKTFSNSLEIKVISPVKGASVMLHPSTDELWEGESLTLYCNITKGTHVSYDWLKNGKSVGKGSSLTIQSLSVQHAGDYQCVASNRLNDTIVFNSSSVVISVGVKEYMSKPEISMDVMKSGVGIFISVKCRSNKGTPPKTFSLLNDKKVIGTETTEGFQVYFNVSNELSRDMGWVRCNASNKGNWMLSEPMSLIVVLNRVSTSVVVVVFSCFILIIISVTACCIYGAVLRRRYPTTYQLYNRYGETKVTPKQKDEDEDDDDKDEDDEEDDYIMMMDYEEDLIHTDSMNDSEEDEQSIDETVLYEEAVSKSFRSI